MPVTCSTKRASASPSSTMRVPARHRHSPAASRQPIPASDERSLAISERARRVPSPAADGEAHRHRFRDARHTAAAHDEHRAARRADRAFVHRLRTGQPRLRVHRRRQFRQGDDRPGLPPLAVEHVPVRGDRAAACGRSLAPGCDAGARSQQDHPLVLRGRVLPARDLYADRDGCRVDVRAPSHARPRQHVAGRARHRTPGVPLGPRARAADAGNDRRLAPDRVQHGPVPGGPDGHSEGPLRGRGGRWLRQSHRPLPDHHVAAARPDHDVRDRDDVDHGVQGVRHRGGDDARRPDRGLRGAALCDLPRRVPVLPHRVRRRADADLPRVHPRVLGRPGFRPGAPHPLRMRRLRHFVALVLVHAFLLAGAAFILLPFVWMLVTSIKPPDEIFTATLRLWPRNSAGVENYTRALTTAPLLRFGLNGLIVCAGILVVQLLVAIPCAYALAKLRFPGRNVLFVLTLLVLAIPVQVPALPLYIALAGVGLLNTYVSMMVPFFLSVFAIFLLRQFFKGFPDDILQAARLDGMSELEIVWRIVVPAAWPAIAAFAVFSFVAHWNDLYWPLIVISDLKLAPPPLGMMYLADAETGSNYGALSAAATILTAPLVIAFLLARRQFVAGITMTGVK